MPDTEKDWKTDWAENLKRLGCLIAVLCFAAVVAGFLAPLHRSPREESRGDEQKVRAEKFLQKGNTCFEAKKYESAVQYFMIAAEQDIPEAQFKLGECYADGNGVEASASEAVKWYRKAAEQGHAEAQYELGDCFVLGTGVEQDFAEAVKWYRKAAEQGYAEAQLNLGWCYYDGSGVEKDLAEALKWIRKSADNGLADAQFAMGCVYAQGTGVKEDKAEAAQWFLKAAEQGNDLAIEALERIGAE